MKAMIAILAFGFFSMNRVHAQDIDAHGTWIYNQAKSHQSPLSAFPANALDLEKRLVFSTKEKRKMGLIVEAFREVQPKPKYHSILFSTTPMFPSPRMDRARLAARDYRFAYAMEFTQIPFWVENGKIVDKEIDWSGSMESTIRTPWTLNFLTVNVNYIPKFLGGATSLRYAGATLDLEREFTYRTINGKESNQPRDLDLGHVVSVTGRADSFAEAARLLSATEGMPAERLGGEADQHIVYRKFVSDRLIYNGPVRLVGKVTDPKDRHKFHDVHNMVILSHNNKLPLVPLSIDQYLTLCEALTRDRIEQFAGNAKMMADQEANLRLIAMLRDAHRHRLSQHAIVALPYAQTWSYRSYLGYDRHLNNQVTGRQDPIGQELLTHFFVADSASGKAYYSYDKGFYKDMVDGEIRTIAVTWTSRSRMPDHPDYSRGFSLSPGAVDTNVFADNPETYLHPFEKRFDWSKLRSLLGK